MFCRKRSSKSINHFIFITMISDKKKLFKLAGIISNIGCHTILDNQWSQVFCQYDHRYPAAPDQLRGVVGFYQGYL